MFRNVSIATLAIIGLAVASPALANGKADDPVAVPAKARADIGPKTRYCIKSEPVTGSIMQGLICKTADQWREEGIDVAKLKARK